MVPITILDTSSLLDTPAEGNSNQTLKNVQTLTVFTLRLDLTKA